MIFHAKKMYLVPHILDFQQHIREILLFPFTVESVMLGIALLPFENGRSVCDLSEQNDAKCVNKQQGNLIISSC